MRVLRRGSRPTLDETETSTPVLRGFAVDVFDASQTSGKNLPDPQRTATPRRRGAWGLGAAVKELIESKGFAVNTVPDASHLQGANGQTDWSTPVVLIRADMDQHGRW